MTVIGESDKEIKSMAFTPCSFLLLFRKYFFITTSVNSKLKIEQEYYTETSPGIIVDATYIKSFVWRINKVGSIVLVNGYVVFNAPGLNINNVITGLPFPSTLQCDFVVGDYGNGETGVMKLQNGSVLMVASSIAPNMEYNTNFAYVIV